MSDCNSESNFVKRIDTHLHIHIDLPADAPDGHPHIINIESFNEEFPPEDLKAVDAIASVLYKWNPKALSDLLDLNKDTFYWCFNNGHGYEIFVSRIGDKVRVGSKELVAASPDYEIRYSIDTIGCWTVTGAREFFCGKSRFLSIRTELGRRQSAEYDEMFAQYLISNKCWRKDSKRQSFRYEVNEEDLMDNEDNEDDEDDGEDEEVENEEDEEDDY